jgi:hypothetical protein
MTVNRLSEALEAWNSHDPEEVLKYMSGDCFYHASFGPELLGKSFVGRAAVREGIRAFFNRYPRGRFVDCEVFVAGSHGAAEWTFVSEEDGNLASVRGCDLFEFDGDLIKVKNAFRKVRDES